MANIIEHSGNDPEVVRIGAGEGSEVSLKIYQDIYHQITGRTEEIRKKYKDSICVEYGDIQQLQIKIKQLLDIHNVVACNESISIFYEKDRKEQFTSFEKFSAFNKNCTSPVSNILLKYDLSIVPAKLQKPQEYSVTIRLSSRLQQLRELKDEAPPFIQGQIALMIASETAEIRIEYADYVIARGFIETFDDWISGCKKTKEFKFIKKMQAKSHYIPPIGKIVTSILYGIFIYLAIEPTLGVEPTLTTLAKYLVFSSVTFIVAVNLAIVFFKLIERAIDNYTFVSWIKLNKGDELMIEESSTSQLKNFVFLIFSVLGAIAIGIISTQVSNFIDKII